MKKIEKTRNRELEVQVHIKRSLHMPLKLYSLKSARTVKEIVSTSVEEYLKKNDK